MLPVDAAGTPLTNAVLYGVDGRATAEIEELTAAIGVERAAGADRQRADLAIGRAEDPLAAAQPAGGLGANGPVCTLDELPGRSG